MKTPYTKKPNIDAANIARACSAHWQRRPHACVTFSNPTESLVETLDPRTSLPAIQQRRKWVADAPNAQTHW